MTSLPDGEVDLYEVMEWAQEQAQFLAPSSTLVLWYLCINAFRTHTNREGRQPGEVMSGRTPMSKIQMRTGLSESSVRRALRDLQDAGYIIAEHKPGNGQSHVTVFWAEVYDDMRAEFRAGVRALPGAFKRAVREPKEGPKLAPVVDIRYGQGDRNNRSG